MCVYVCMYMWLIVKGIICATYAYTLYMRHI